MSTTGVAASPRRNSATIASPLPRPTPCFNARSEERWITGPSAIGSEKGTPSSITSAPALTTACITATVSPGEGSPAVTNGISAERFAARSFSKVAVIRLIGGVSRPGGSRRERDPRGLADGVHVLVAAAREVHEEDAVLGDRRGELHRIGERVARLERRYDPLEAAERVEGGERLVVGDGHVLRAPHVLEPRMLRAHAGVVEAGGDRVRLLDLPVGVLHEVGAVAVQHSRPAGA